MNEIKFAKRILDTDKKRNAQSVVFYDVLIDGNSVYDQFEGAECDLACIFGFYRKNSLNIEVINEFLKAKPSKLKTGRNMLLVCRECGDIGCGAITVEIHKTEHSYIWRYFAHENDSSELPESDYLKFETKEFEKIHYEQAFELLKETV